MCVLHVYNSSRHLLVLLLVIAVVLPHLVRLVLRRGAELLGDGLEQLPRVLAELLVLVLLLLVELEADGQPLARRPPHGAPVVVLVGAGGRRRLGALGLALLQLVARDVLAPAAEVPGLDALVVVADELLEQLDALLLHVDLEQQPREADARRKVGHVRVGDGQAAPDVEAAGERGAGLVDLLLRDAHVGDRLPGLGEAGGHERRLGDERLAALLGVGLPRQVRHVHLGDAAQRAGEPALARLEQRLLLRRPPPRHLVERPDLRPQRRRAPLEPPHAVLAAVLAELRQPQKLLRPAAARLVRRPVAVERHGPCERRPRVVNLAGLDVDLPDHVGAEQLELAAGARRLESRRRRAEGVLEVALLELGRRCLEQHLG
ncbi:hypothetical protein BN1708_000469, partial [Verticillium longisporum]